LTIYYLQEKKITGSICMQLLRYAQRIEMSNRRGSLNSFRSVSGLNIPREKWRWRTTKHRKRCLQCAHAPQTHIFTWKKSISR